MTNSQRLAKVRDRLRFWLSEQQSTDAASPAEITGEAVLIVDGFYCGRRFHAGSFHAIWFIEEDELKIHDEQGKLLCVLNSAEINRELPTEAPVAEEAHLSPSPSYDIIPMPQANDSGNAADDNDEIRRAA